MSIGLPTYDFYGPATPINRWQEAVYLQEWQKLLQILTTHPLHLWVYLIKKIQLKHLFMVWELWNDIWAWSCFTEILWWTQVSNGCSVCVFQVFWGPSSPSFHHYQVLSLSSHHPVLIWNGFVFLLSTLSDLPVFLQTWFTTNQFSCLSPNLVYR